jgi:uncharacterized protein
MNRQLMHGMMGALSGILFGVGLALSGMTDPVKVIGFLDITGNWMPALMWVMGGALAVNALAYLWMRRRSTPLCDERFHWPSLTRPDKRLVTGAALFGVGWGLYGYCPGPALGALVYGDYRSGLFVVAMVAGMAIADRMWR